MKSITEKKLQANRENAKKSSGPTSTEGKASSSRNAFKHGLRAQKIVVTTGPSPENPKEFISLLEELRADFQAQGRLENMLVERIAHAFWRLRRAWRFEAQAVNEVNEYYKSPSAQSIAAITGIEPRPAKAILPSDSDLDRLVRYESMIDRELHRSMRLLQRIRQNRPTQDPKDETDSKLEN